MGRKNVFLMYYMITGLGAALIHTGFTWYDIHTMQESVNLFLNNVTPMDFKMLVTKYQGYLRHDDISVLNEFLGSWSNSPNDPQMIQEAKSFAQELVSRKADIPTVGASGAVFRRVACLWDAISKYSALYLFCISN
jgi:membrane associated rhomboid family serine protease